MQSCRRACPNVPVHTCLVCRFRKCGEDLFVGETRGRPGSGVCCSKNGINEIWWNLRSTLNLMPPLQHFRVQDRLLRILKMVGATEKLYTTNQIISYLGKYIEQRKLYDSSNIRVVHCKDDPLESLFGVQVFTIGDYNDIWRLVCPYLIPATNKEVEMNDIEKNRQQPDSSTSEDGQRTDFKWMSQLPWWYFVDRDVNSGNNHDKATASGSIVAHSTAYVVDTDYESDTNDSKFTNLGTDTEDPFSIEYEPDSDSSDATEPIISDDEPQFSLPPSRPDEVYETTTTTTDTTDMCLDLYDFPLEDHWRCTECETVNPPTLAYCQRCWKLRKGWLPKSAVDSPFLTKSLTAPLGTATPAGDAPMLERSCSMPNSLPGVDVCDGRRGSIRSGEGSSTKELPVPESNFASLPFNNSKRKQDGPESGQEPPSKKFSQSPSDNEASTSKKQLSFGNSLNNSDSMQGNSSNATGTSSNQAATCSFSSPGLCNICHNNPNDATIVHGKFGHQFCCYRCAKRLKKSGKTCPVCRQPIAFVIKNYICLM